MHSLEEALLNHWKLDVGLIATLAFHLCRDTTDDDDHVSVLDLCNDVREVIELTLADIGIEHSEWAIATAVDDLHVVGLAILYVEGLVLRSATETEATALALLLLLYYLTVDLEDVTIVRTDGIAHLTGEIGGDPTDLVLKEGDAFILDLSVRYDDAWSDTCRTFFLGEPSDEQKKAYQTVLDAQDIGQKLVRTGVKASDVKTCVEAFMVSRGFGGMMPHHVGHAIGDEPYMKPAFEEGCDINVADGEIFTLEPGLYKEGSWGMRVENNYIIEDISLIGPS